MKRRSLIKILKTGILIFGISLLLWNCKQDQNEFLDTLSIEQVIPNYSQKIVSLTKVPEVEKYLNDKLPKNSFQRTNEETGITMNYDAVLELVDSLENLSYSIRFTFDDSPEGEFFNLVVGKTIEGEFTQPRVLGYVCDEEQVEIFVAHHYDMNYFKGTVSLYNYVTFFSHAERTKRSRTTTGSINIEPCDQQTYTGGGGDPYDSNNPDDWNPIDPEGTGGGSGLGDIDTSSGSGGSCTWSWGTTGPCDEGGHGVHSPSSCGAGTGVSPVLNINCDGVRTVDELGCGDPVPIGVNSEDDKIKNGLDGEELCVYQKLKNLDLFKSTIKKFEDSDDYTLVLKYGNCSTTDLACTDGSKINDGYVSIIFETGVNGSPLEFASILLHEGIHAELYKYVHEYENGIDPNERENLLFYYFEAKKAVDPKYVDALAQHQHMADNYVKPIAEAIRKLDNNSYPLEHYMGFGWDGLRKYGYDGYYDDGNWVSLDNDTSTEYYQNQATVINNTNVRSDDCE